MKKKIAGNCLRAHRRRHGLSQRELGILVGYKQEWQVSRHELSKAVPPLTIALAYEVVFRIPVAQLFMGVQSAVSDNVALKFADLKAAVERQTAKRQSAKVTAQKLTWLTERSTA